MNPVKYLASLLILLLVGAVYATSYPTYGGYEQNYDKTLIFGIPYNYAYSVGEDPEAQANRIAKKVMDELKRQFEFGKAAEEKKVEELDPGAFRLVGNEADVDLDRQVLAIFNSACIKCHKPGATKPGVQLLTLDRKMFVNSDPKREEARRERVYESLVDSDEPMPKGGRPLSSEQKALVRQWADAVKR